MENQKLTYKHGFFFPNGGLIFGIVLLVMAIPSLLHPSNFFRFCVGVAIACIGLLFFSTKGLDIDTYAKRFRIYTRLYGIKVGKMNFLNNFKYITIINQGYTQSSFSQTSVEVKSEFSTYNLLLLNDTHHLKQFVVSFNNYEKALEEAKKLSEALNFEIVKYDPVRTRGRKK